MIGGASKWKQKFLEKKIIIDGEEIELKACLVEKLSDAYVVELSWYPGEYSFAEIIEHAGDTPLPPYIKRKAEETDVKRYQTIYSKFEGSVAAPTAGLHFTREIFSSLQEKHIEKGFVTLHVGAGTFKPVKSATMGDHEMHAEWIDVSVSFIEQLINNIESEIICIGTTSVRTIESLYWMGLKTLLNPGIAMDDLGITQWEVYEDLLAKNSCTAKESLNFFIAVFEKAKHKQAFYTNTNNNCTRLSIQTHQRIDHQFSSAKIYFVVIGCRYGRRRMEKHL